MNFAEIAALLSGQAALALGWRPAEFWNATPAELQSVVDANAPANASPSQDVIAQLMELFPDG